MVRAHSSAISPSKVGALRPGRAHDATARAPLQPGTAVESTNRTSVRFRDNNGITVELKTVQPTKLTLKVHTGRGQVGYDVNSTMISGERDMLVIDPQFSLSEAHKLAAEILESKKNLTIDLYRRIRIRITCSDLPC